jgi:beta-1,4-N-acetylglucosaminyltransferase
VIFVTVGTHSAPFDRLVRSADKYAATSGERVVIQRGAATYLPVVAQSFKFCDSLQMEDLMRRSRVVVCHAADTILDAIRLARPVVAVPRLHRYGEHLNDHQVDLANALAERGHVVALHDVGRLAEAIDAAPELPVPVLRHPPAIATAIRRRLTQWFPNIETPDAAPEAHPAVRERIPARYGESDR